MDAETVLSEWPTVWVGKSTAKDHLSPTCPVCPDDYRRKSAAQYPPAHLDLCSVCADDFEAWRGATGDGDPTVGCDRCPAETATQHGEHRLCDECRQQVLLRR